MKIEKYIEDVWGAKYISPIPNHLYETLEGEGWLEQQEEYLEETLYHNDLAYFALALSEEDKLGLINAHESTIEKFNDFDIALKDEQQYPYPTCDFIDYEKGIVYIVAYADAVMDDE